MDLLLEVEQLDWLLDYTDEKNYSRTCLYLISCCRYLAEPDDMRVLESTYNIYCKVGRFSDALRIAIKMKKYDLVEEIFAKETDTIAKKQLAYILGQNVSDSISIATGYPFTLIGYPEAALRTHQEKEGTACFYYGLPDQHVLNQLWKHIKGIIRLLLYAPHSGNHNTVLRQIQTAHVQVSRSQSPRPTCRQLEPVPGNLSIPSQALKSICTG